ncbi:MAG: MarR family transcriptional regulator [Anaerolineae bacterium]|nr:MarR family transcriptional regulator [Anaerolineae bacterium]
MSPNELSPPEPTEIESRVLLNWIFKLMIRDLDEYLRARAAPISSLQYGILRVLRHGTQSLSELGKRMLLSPATLVPAVDALVKQDYVSRERDPNDRRRVQLSLTESGNALVRQLACQPLEDSYHKAWQTLSLEQREQLLSLLRHIITEMSESPDEIRARLAEIVKMHLRQSAE